MAAVAATTTATTMTTMTTLGSVAMVAAAQQRDGGGGGKSGRGEGTEKRHGLYNETRLAGHRLFGATRIVDAGIRP